jgi:hypothetical protein
MLDDFSAGDLTGFMRVLSGLLSAVILGAGCAAPKTSPPTVVGAPPAAPSSRPIVTPDLRSVGRVAMVNMQGRFVVLSFPPGPVPQPGERLNVNHAGLKIGEIKITGPQRDYDTVADLTQGEANVGDEAKGE